MHVGFTLFEFVVYGDKVVRAATEAPSYPDHCAAVPVNDARERMETGNWINNCPIAEVVQTPEPT